MENSLVVLHIYYLRSVFILHTEFIHFASNQGFFFK